MRIFRLLLLLTSCGALPSVIPAQTTIHVPEDQPTIQAGINAAQNGDTVLVAPGTYQENIDFKGKTITVTSGATTSGGASAAIIEAPGPDPVVSFVSGESPAAVLNGFTLTHSSNVQTTATYSGDGIGIVNASPTVTNNILLNNPGCGIYARTPPALLLKGNTITGQSGGPCLDVAGQASGGNGGAIFISGGGTLKILDNAITNYHGGPDPDNNAVYENQGIYVYGAQSLLLQNNIVTGNTGGASDSIEIQDTSAVSLVQNLVYGNSSTNGLYLLNDSGNPLSLVMTNNTIVVQGQDPSSPVYQPEVGSGLYLVVAASVTSTVSNNIFSTLSGGVAVGCEFFSSQGAIAPPSSTAFTHNDVYQPGNTPIYQCAPSANTSGNLTGDPQFINLPNGNLHVKPTSPIVAAGDVNAPQIPPTDLAGKNRFVCGTVDMGVYEVHPRPATLVTSSNNPSVGGNSVTFTATVPGNCNVPTGTVTFMDGATALGTVTLDSSATASLTTSALTVGTHTITVTYPGDFNFYKSTSAPLTQVVTGYPTATTLTVSPNPASAFTPVTLSSTVSSNFGQPTGTVIFTAGGQTLATAAIGATGQAATTISTLGTGTYSIVATYQATTNFASSSSATTNETVVGAESVTALNASPNPATAGQTVTFTAMVRAAQGNAIPTGMVTFRDGTNVLGSGALNSIGAATFSTSSLAIGTHTITASYAGSSNFNPSSASVTETVTAITTSTSLTVSPNPAGQGQTVTLTATVTSPDGALGGIVTFEDGSTSLGTATLNGSGIATFTDSTLSVGTHNLTAVYEGGGSLGASTSPAVQETIDAAGFNLSLSPSLLTLRVGQSGTVGVNVGSYGNYSGTVSLSVSSLPNYVAGTFSPSSLSIQANGNVTSTLTISTAIVPDSAVTSRDIRASSNAIFTGAIAAFLFVPGAFRKRFSIAKLLMIVLGLIMVVNVSACGGTVEIPVHMVLPGTYVVSVAGTDANSNTKTAQLTVTVTP